MRTLGVVLCVAGVLLAIPPGFLMLVAFSDAANMCPGQQCRDALGFGATAGTLTAALLLASFLGLRRLGKGRRRP